MEPLDIYAKVAPLVKNEITNAIQEDRVAHQYDVVKIPAHTHNRVDSTGLVFASAIEDAPSICVVSRVTVPTASVLALHSTPYTLIPAQGSRTILVVDSITAQLKYQTAAYTGTNNLEFRYTDGSGTKVVGDMPTSFLNSGSTTYWTSWPINLAPTVGAAVVLAVPTANPAAGTSPIIFVINYRLVPFA
jgi:hypothetical protein